MRPPLHSTPPVSHVISRKFQPTPAVTCRHDWRNLTSDTSIQIMSLETSQYHEESMREVSNHLSFVDTIISPRAADIFQGQPLTSSLRIDEADIAETLISVDSLTHHHGDMFDARIIFTPKRPCQVTGARYQATSHIPHQTDIFESSRCQQRLTRHFYSDSNLDIQRRANHEQTNKEASVTRSMSMSYSEYSRRKNDNCFVKPLLPCANRSKIGGIKRIPSFRDTVKSVPVVSAQPEVNIMGACINNKNMKAVDLDSKCRSQGGEKAQKADIPQSRITKLVKCGIRSVMKSKNTDKCAAESDSLKNVQAMERRRQRRIRYTTDIGGLSEFLRRNERRKTIAVSTEVKRRSAINTNVTSLQTDIDASDIETAKPNTGSRRMHSMGMSNLQFNQCQRKLVFQNSHGSPKMNADYDPSNYVDKYMCSDVADDSKTRRRPRLGVRGSTKHIVPIDELDIDLVRDLKRRVERANKSTKIKTNGSLKVKHKALPIDKPTVSSPRRKATLCRQNRVSTICPGGIKLRLKRESVV